MRCYKRTKAQKQWKIADHHFMVAQHWLKPSINANEVRMRQKKLSQPTVKLFTEASLFFSREFNAFNIRIKDRTEIESIEHNKKQRKSTQRLFSISYWLLCKQRLTIQIEARTIFFSSYSPSGQNWLFADKYRWFSPLFFYTHQEHDWMWLALNSILNSRRLSIEELEENG